MMPDKAVAEQRKDKWTRSNCKVREISATRITMSICADLKQIFSKAADVAF
jgi:hypothetical protein